jgi:uncharacterized protein (DUF302 family)
MNPTPDDGLIHLSSPYSVDETVRRLETALQSKGITIFCRIDHSSEAEKIGIKMHPTRLFLVGSPKSGTPLMLAAPTVAIDLPLKVLIWESADFRVWLSFNSPEYLQRRHKFSPDLLPNIAGIGALLQTVVVS